MDMIVREYIRDDAEKAVVTWNHIVEEGIAFPRTDYLAKENADAFFSEQSLTGTAFDRHNGAVVGLYILHPNDMGRRGHICNANYTVKWDMRGRQTGEKLVRHYMEKGGEPGSGILQFNAVVKTNEAALHLYQKLEFTRLGVTPGGSLMKNGRYEDVIPHYIVL